MGSIQLLVTPCGADDGTASWNSETRLDTSVGEARLGLRHAFRYTAGLLLPRVCEGIFLVAASVVAMVVISNVDRLVIIACSVVLVSLVALLTSFLWRVCHLHVTGLNQRVEGYRKVVLSENPHPLSVSRGPSRGINAHQLHALFKFFEGFIKGRNLYYMDSNILKPLTEPFQLSYAEMVGPSTAKWFISHFWGTPFVFSIVAIERHAKSVCTTAGNWSQESYWMCTFSNNQWNVKVEVGDGRWQDSSFHITLRSGHCQGTCMILDEQALPLTRSWCLFELLQTMKLAEETPSTFQGLQFCTNTGIVNNGTAAIEISQGIGKRLATLTLEDASASLQEDKDMIDNLVVQEMGGFASMGQKLRGTIRRALEKSRESALSDWEDLFERLERRSSQEEVTVGGSYTGVDAHPVRPEHAVLRL